MIVATLARIRMSIRPRAVVDHLFWTVTPFVTLISVWQAVASAGVVSRLWLPSPGTVWSAFLEVLAAGNVLEKPQGDPRGGAVPPDRGDPPWNCTRGVAGWRRRVAAVARSPCKCLHTPLA